MLLHTGDWHIFLLFRGAIFFPMFSPISCRILLPILQLAYYASINGFMHIWHIAVCNLPIMPVSNRSMHIWPVQYADCLLCQYPSDLCIFGLVQYVTCPLCQDPWIYAYFASAVCRLPIMPGSMDLCIFCQCSMRNAYYASVGRFMHIRPSAVCGMPIMLVSGDLCISGIVGMQFVKITTPLY
jgi:hypothetical protein